MSGTHMKGRTYEDIYGPEKAAQLRLQRSLKAKETKLGSRFKGKTYLEIMGPEKAASVIISRSKNAHHLLKNVRGKTYEEIYGPIRGKALKKKRSGNNHWMWKNGISAYRGKNWGVQRKKTLKRDKYTCQDCKKTGVPLDVHHLIPYRLKKSNAIKGLISLCRNCHTKWDKRWRKENPHSFARTFSI